MKKIRFGRFIVRLIYIDAEESALNFTFIVMTLQSYVMLSYFILCHLLLIISYLMFPTS